MIVRKLDKRKRRVSGTTSSSFYRETVMMKLHRLEHRCGKGSVTFGCIWNPGEVTKNSSFMCQNETGVQVPLQSRITAYYQDGSIKWTAHTADAEKLGTTFTVMPEEKSAVCPSQVLQIIEQENAFFISDGEVSFLAMKSGSSLIRDVRENGTVRIRSVSSVLKLESRTGSEENPAACVRTLAGEIRELSLEEKGPLQITLKFSGIHVLQEEKKIPFVIRISYGIEKRKFHILYTFFYDGDEEKDFLKGIGIETRFPASGAVYNRHIRFLGDEGSFSESSAELLTWRPRIPSEIYRAQIKGEEIHPNGEDLQKVQQVTAAMPFWDRYDIVQDSAQHFVIRKKQKGENLCWLDCLHGSRARGALSIGSETGCCLFGIRDFWQRYPSGYTVSGMTEEEIRVDAWIYSPSAQSFDFRHYADRGYNQSYYEGYDFKGASAYGIGVTSELRLAFSDGICASEEELSGFSFSVNKPPVCVGTPKYYHDHHAFGYWSLQESNSESRCWIEQQLDKAVDFYLHEVDQRNWYGLFNYGDFMHTYDPVRHVWRYDMGGYAWDNTELVPTLWLWLTFLRTGREDIFSLAERLSRHTSEVDVYHFGDYKGMGSRHNVRHWGCPCKEARIAMAAHHRVFYYLTGDFRMGDIFTELKDNEWTFLKKDPLGEFFSKKDMVYPSHARSGPDWSSLCANWMTQYERTLDDTYRKKIETGTDDIYHTPLKLISGPDFEFDPKTVHLRYIGDRATGGTHLQICMGAAEVWLEMADIIGDDRWKEMLISYGEFYFLPYDEQRKRAGGRIGDRVFTFPFMAAALGAYSAMQRKDHALARKVWSVLLGTLIGEHNTEGFSAIKTMNSGNRKELKEIPWISTNFVSQFCLNAILCLEFIPDDLPSTLTELMNLVRQDPDSVGFHRA